MNSFHIGKFSLLPQIVKRVTEQGWIQVFDPHQKVYYAYKDNQWVGYDNRHSLAIKVRVRL